MAADVGVEPADEAHHEWNVFQKSLFVQELLVNLMHTIKEFLDVVETIEE